MKCIETVCGNPYSPVAGSNVFQSDLLKGAVVHFIILNNGIENGLSPSPEFTLNSSTGELMRVNKWMTGDKAIIVYSNCSNCNQIFL